MPWNRQNPFWRSDSLKKPAGFTSVDGWRPTGCVMRELCELWFFSKALLNPNQIGRLQFWTNWTSQNWAKQTSAELGKHLRCEGLQVSYENHLWITLRNSMPFNHFLKTKYQQLESFLLSVRVHQVSSKMAMKGAGVFNTSHLTQRRGNIWNFWKLLELIIKHYQIP